MAEPKVLPQKADIGLQAFTDRITRFRPQTRIQAAQNQRHAFDTFFKKLGASAEDLADLRKPSVAYARDTRRALIESVASKATSPRDLVLNAAHLLNSVDYVGKGRAIPMQGIVTHRSKYPGSGTPQHPPPPPEVYSLWLPPDTWYQGAHVHVEGKGGGLHPDDESEAWDVQWVFNFTPTDSRLYSFFSGLLYGGPYYFFSNDDWWDSKEIYAFLTCWMEVRQILPVPMENPVNGYLTDGVDASTTPINLIFEIADNIAESGGFGTGQQLFLNTFLFANSPVQVTVAFSIEGDAFGESSVVDMNFAPPVGAMACTGLWVT